MDNTIKVKKLKWRSSEKQIYFMAMCGIAFLLVFSYFPMYGVILAFKDADRVLNLSQAIWTADFVGLENFKEFFYDNTFWTVLQNTLGLNLLMLLINFPMPIIFALLLNEVNSRMYRKSIQTITTFPHFISWIIFGGIVIALTDMTTGVINPILELLGLSSSENPVDLRLPQYFWTEMIIVSLIKGVGWGSIVYVAAIAKISPDIYESAKIDGANRFVCIFKITLPMISSTITVFLLLTVSGLLGNSFEQFYAMQTSANLEKSEVLTTYIYMNGFSRRKYSYAAAIGLFDSCVSLLLLLLSNFISRKVTGRGLFV